MGQWQARLASEWEPVRGRRPSVGVPFGKGARDAPLFRLVRQARDPKKRKEKRVEVKRKRNRVSLREWRVRAVAKHKAAWRNAWPLMVGKKRSAPISFGAPPSLARLVAVPK